MNSETQHKMFDSTMCLHRKSSLRKLFSDEALHVGTLQSVFNAEKLICVY